MEILTPEFGGLEKNLEAWNAGLDMSAALLMYSRLGGNSRSDFFLDKQLHTRNTTALISLSPSLDSLPPFSTYISIDSIDGRWSTHLIPLNL